MKRDITMYAVFLSLCFLGLEYGKPHLGKFRAFIVAMLIMFLFGIPLNTLLHRMCDALKWPNRSEMTNGEVHLTAFVSVAIAMLVMILVTHFFPPEKETKTKSAGEVSQIEAEPISADEETK